MLFTDESSEDDHGLKKNTSSCETLNKLGTLELSTSSNATRKSGRAHKMARQTQLKRYFLIFYVILEPYKSRGNFKSTGTSYSAMSVYGKSPFFSFLSIRNILLNYNYFFHI